MLSTISSISLAVCFRGIRWCCRNTPHHFDIVCEFQSVSATLWFDSLNSIACPPQSTTGPAAKPRAWAQRGVGGLQKPRSYGERQRPTHSSPSPPLNRLTGGLIDQSIIRVQHGPRSSWSVHFKVTLSPSFHGYPPCCSTRNAKHLVFSKDADLKGLRGSSIECALPFMLTCSLVYSHTCTTTTSTSTRSIRCGQLSVYAGPLPTMSQLCHLHVMLMSTTG